MRANTCSSFDNVLDKQRSCRVWRAAGQSLLAPQVRFQQCSPSLPQAMKRALAVIAKKRRGARPRNILWAMRALSCSRPWTCSGFEHLESMEYLRGSVKLARAYGQRDPLVEYRKEGCAHIPRDGKQRLPRKRFRLLRRSRRTTQSLQLLPQYLS